MDPGEAKLDLVLPVHLRLQGNCLSEAVLAGKPNGQRLAQDALEFPVDVVGGLDGVPGARAVLVVAAKSNLPLEAVASHEEVALGVLQGHDAPGRLEGSQVVLELVGNVVVIVLEVEGVLQCFLLDKGVPDEVKLKKGRLEGILEYARRYAAL